MSHNSEIIVIDLVSPPKSSSTATTTPNPLHFPQLSLQCYSDSEGQIQVASSRAQPKQKSLAEKNKTQPERDSSNQQKDVVFEGDEFIASFQSYSEFRRNIEFASSTVENGSIGIAVVVADGTEEEIVSFGPTSCNLDSRSKSGQRRNQKSIVASLHGCSTSTQGQFSPLKIDVYNKNILGISDYEDDEDGSFSDCSACFGSRLEDEDEVEVLSSDNEEMACTTPEQGSSVDGNSKSMVKKERSGKLSADENKGTDLENFIISTYSGFQKELHESDEEQEQKFNLSSSIIPESPQNPGTSSTSGKSGGSNCKKRKREKESESQKLGALIYCETCSKPIKKITWSELENMDSPVLLHKKCPPCDYASFNSKLNSSI